LAPAPFKTSAVVFTALVGFHSRCLFIGYSLFLELSSRSAREAVNIGTRTHRHDKMAGTLHIPADKMACTLQTLADKTSGRSLRKRKWADNTDTSGSRMRTHKADNRAAGGTLRTHNHSMGDGTWRNRKRRSHRN